MFKLGAIFLAQQRMRGLFVRTLILLLPLLLLFPTFGHTQTISKNLSECLIKNLTLEDKRLLQVWFIMGLGKNPVMRGLITVDEELLQKMNVAVARQFERFVFEECSDEFRSGMANRQTNVFGEAFQTLGKSVMLELSMHPSSVEHSRAPFEFVDRIRLEEFIKDAMKLQ